MLQVKREANVTFLQSEALAGIPRIVHAFSTRRAERADFTLASSTSPNPLVQMNRVRFFAAAGTAGWPVAWLNQVHSAVVYDIDDTSAANEPITADSSVTTVEGIALAIQTADCVPILIADRDARCAAAVHAGWRGTVTGIASAAVSRLVEKFGANSSNLIAAIGPHIGVCCYEVGEEVASAFSAGEAQAGQPAALIIDRSFPKPHLNLGAANRAQLSAAGIPLDQIEVSSLCTRCREDLFFSYRREGNKAGRMLSIIGITP